ncbi:MAG: hypothetical protein RL653_2693, partial [Pseudomonadota bacterium]
MRVLLETLRRSLVFSRALLAVVLALAWMPAAHAEGALTLWLTRPLYPGQDNLVARTDAALRGMFPPEALKGEIIGRAELARVLESQPLALGCILGESACADPVEAVISGLGVGRVVLLKAGQDESGYRYRATSWTLGGEAVVGEGQGAQLEKALLSTLVKVVPVGASLVVESTPAGATIFVDGEQVGQSPATLQLLPGEHAVKLELASHLPAEARVKLVARGQTTFSRTLEKVPARLVVEALPEGVAIAVDGQFAAKDRLDRGIQPGVHTVGLSLEGYLPHEEKLDIAPGGTARVQRTLQPTTWFQVKTAMGRAQDEEAARRLYLSAAYEFGAFLNKGYRTSLDPGLPRVDSFKQGDLPAVSGVNAEVGVRWRYGGLALFGVSTFASARGSRALATFAVEENQVQPDGSTVTVVVPQQREASLEINGVTLRLLQPQFQLLLWRFALGVQGGVATRGALLFLDGDKRIGVAGGAPVSWDGLLL